MIRIAISQAAFVAIFAGGGGGVMAEVLGTWAGLDRRVWRGPAMVAG